MSNETSVVLCCTLLLVFHAVRTVKSTEIRLNENELDFYKTKSD
jgi:hypothetical protein